MTRTGNADPVAKKSRKNLSPRARRLLIIGGVLEGVLKIAALIDLGRRPATEIQGSKRRWVVAVALINSIGAVPIAYFVWGRRKS